MIFEYNLKSVLSKGAEGHPKVRAMRSSDNCLGRQGTYGSIDMQIVPPYLSVHTPLAATTKLNGMDLG
jgi:hypothetical protein